MINTVKDLLSATGKELLQPINFGSFSGRFLYDLSTLDIGDLSSKTETPTSEIYNQVIESREIKNHTNRRRDFDVKNNIPGLTLLDWQLKKSIEHKSASFIGCFAKMGTGKTIFTLNYIRARSYKHDKILIVCPKNVFKTWQDSLDQWLPQASYAIGRGSSKVKIEKIKDKTRQFYVTNYESFISKDFCLAASKVGFTWIVLDESHKIKNAKAKRTKAINKIAASIEMRIALTGTPFEKDEIDLFSQVMFLDRGLSFGNNIHRFKRLWGREIQVTKTVKKFIFNEKMKNNFHEKIKDFTFIINKSDVLDLPDKVYQSIEVDLTGECRRVYKEILVEAMSVFNNEEILAIVKIAEITKLRQLTGGTVKSSDGVGLLVGQDKINALLDYFDGYSDQAVIVCNWRLEIEEIKKQLEKKFNILIGASGGQKEQTLIENRQSFIDGKTQFLLLNQQAGAEGIDGLQACQNMIFYDCHYSRTLREQIEDRLHRKGQTHKCNYLDILATVDGRPSIDHAVIDSIKAKSGAVDDIIKRMLGANN